MGFGKEVAAVLDAMREEKECYKNYVSQKSFAAGTKMVSAIKNLQNELLDEIMELVKAEIPLENVYAGVWWYSVLVAIRPEPKLFKEFVKYVRENQKVFSANTKYFLFYQLKSLRFRFSELDDKDVQAELLCYFFEVVDDFEKMGDMSLEPIPLEKRDHNKVLVLTEQFIEIQHGPTKTALDRCKCLIDKLGKDILLINTTEILSDVGNIPFYNAVQGSFLDRKRQELWQEWKGVRIPYYQCEHHMPDRKQLSYLLEEIRKMAPEYVISIGGSGMLANLVNQMVPVIAVGLCPSDLEFTTCKYQTLGRKIEEKDERILKTVGYTKKNVIESIFTSSLKPQTEYVTREELGIAKDKFLLVTVGVRLDEEITDAFLEMLERTILPEMQWVIWGDFSKCREYLENYPKLKKQTYYMGFCADILSRIEHCNLYINPTRKGGGTSCVEAMYKGIPVVSVNYGDVSVNAGEEFCVSDYGEMGNRILKLYSDRRYYEQMSQKAQKRVKVLLDTDAEFERIIKEVMRREMEEK